ncbi:hypothetical protein [Streptomyces chilikensis]|uniref:hypothetical protein n=1 Tax=Streptomyces chilikensis TaxID=1194079 RepID=UPI0014095AF6|nr:hypothetical protein [Streptomyces chilikensis]
MNKKTSRAAAVGAAALIAAALTGGQASADEAGPGRITSVQQLQEGILRAAAHERETAAGAELGTGTIGKAVDQTSSV